jgi:tetratricopeptide (TPR) repeat protein
LAKYAEVVAKYRGTGAAMPARLGQAGVLLDKRDADAALTAYRDVRSSPLACADGEVRGRALEGIGLVYELKAFLNPSERGAMLDEALKAFRELEKTDVRGFRELGMYHQARVLEAQGDRATALEVLKKVHAEISKQGEATVFPYLDTVVDDRIRALDPSALPAKNPYGKMDMSDPRMRQLLEQLQRGQRGQEQKP